MNECLREKDRGKLKPWRHYIWLLMNALREVPPSDVLTVIRGCKRHASILGGQCIKGEEFVWSAFSSTATTVDVMQTFLGESGPRTLFMLTLQPGIGRCVKDFSLFPTENEVVLPPNTEFEVVATVNLGHELTQVQCKQIESLDMILDMSEGFIASTPAPAPAPGRSWLGACHSATHKSSILSLHFPISAAVVQSVEQQLALLGFSKEDALLGAQHGHTLEQASNWLLNQKEEETAAPAPAPVHMVGSRGCIPCAVDGDGLKTQWAEHGVMRVLLPSLPLLSAGLLPSSRH
jgi:hypothetical protein